MELMDTGCFRRLPVAENGTMAGIISIPEAVWAHIQSLAHEVDSLKDYVTGLRRQTACVGIPLRLWGVRATPGA